MTFRSHTEKEIRDAFGRKDTVCVLNSGTHGADDILIGSLEDCQQDIITNEEENVFETQGWTLSEIDSITEAI